MSTRTGFCGGVIFEDEFDRVGVSVTAYILATTQYGIVRYNAIPLAGAYTDGTSLRGLGNSVYVTMGLWPNNYFPSHISFPVSATTFNFTYEVEFTGLDNAPLYSQYDVTLPTLSSNYHVSIDIQKSSATTLRVDYNNGDPNFQPATVYLSDVNFAAPFVLSIIKWDGDYAYAINGLVRFYAPVFPTSITGFWPSAYEYTTPIGSAIDRHGLYEAVSPFGRPRFWTQHVSATEILEP